jgi:hypothetical protein
MLMRNAGYFVSLNSHATVTPRAIAIIFTSLSVISCAPDSILETAAWSICKPAV